MNKQDKALKILQELKKAYPKTGPFISWHSPLELVIATVLSAQCKDERVNKVTKKLFQKYKTPQDYAKANIKELESEIYTLGFYKNKAKFLKRIGKILENKFHGKVPDSLEELLELPGVAKKTAYLVLGKAFHKNIGIAVDTHVQRIAPRLGLTKSNNANTISNDLSKIFPKKDYVAVNEYLITHGRACCKPKPKCLECSIQTLCPSAKKFIKFYQW